MSKLPIVSGADVVKALEKAGFRVVRTRGSHASLRHPDTGRGVTVPLHKSVKRGTLGSIVRQAGMTSEEFRDLF